MEISSGVYISVVIAIVYRQYIDLTYPISWMNRSESMRTVNSQTDTHAHVQNRKKKLIKLWNLYAANHSKTLHSPTSILIFPFGAFVRITMRFHCCDCFYMNESQFRRKETKQQTNRSFPPFSFYRLKFTVSVLPEESWFPKIFSILGIISISSVLIVSKVVHFSSFRQKDFTFEKCIDTNFVCLRLKLYVK